MCRQAGAICSSRCPLSNQSVSGGGAWLISHSPHPHLSPKTDALGNQANQYASSPQSHSLSLIPSLSPPARALPGRCRPFVTGNVAWFFIRHHHLVRVAPVPAQRTGETAGRTHAHKSVHTHGKRNTCVRLHTMTTF